MEINAIDYDIKAGEDVTVALQKALCEIAKIKGDKTLSFEKGEYHFHSSKACSRVLYITNTVGDKQWKRGEVQHLNRAALWLENQQDLTLDGNGSVFVLHGRMTNAVLIGCKNVRLKNITFRTENPDMHELEVVRVGKFHVEFAVDKGSRYHKINCQYCFVGEDYRSRFTKHSNTAYWIGKVSADDTDSICRVAHPLRGALYIKEIEPHLFKVTFVKTGRFKVGDRYYVYDERRKYNGIFVDRCERITLESIEQNFNYGLALVCQDSADIDVAGCRFAPKEGSDFLMASAADFIQICMCRGKVSVRDSEFVGAGDDCINVHGIHFKIVKIKEDTVEVKFCHHQTHGFNPLKAGDRIAFIAPTTLLEQGRAKIVDSQLVDEHTIRLKLDSVAGAKIGEVIENKSAVPEFEFVRNRMNRIITRGVLMTGGGKALIADNDFVSTSMHSILISDDAKSWFESGNVNGVEITRNRFGRCVGYNVQVLPENTVHEGAVHKDIYIHDNEINSGDEGGFYFKSTDGVVIENNVSEKPVKTVAINSQVKEVK